MQHDFEKKRKMSLKFSSLKQFFFQLKWRRSVAFSDRWRYMFWCLVLGLMNKDCARLNELALLFNYWNNCPNYHASFSHSLSLFSVFWVQSSAVWKRMWSNFFSFLEFLPPSCLSERKFWVKYHQRKLLKMQKTNRVFQSYQDCCASPKSRARIYDTRVRVINPN